nr:kdo(2)-lipid A phosphoethanolamine 7''-transferase [uncultured Moellerella sp.]
MIKFILRNIPQSHISVSLLLSIFIGIFLNLYVYYGRFGTELTDSQMASWFYLIAEILLNVAFTFFLLRLISLGGAWFFKICASVIIVASVCASYYITFYDVVIGYGIIISTLTTTDLDLSREFIGVKFILWVLVLTIIPLSLLWLSPLKNTLLSQIRNRTGFLKSLLILLLIALAVFSTLKLLDRYQHQLESKKNVDLSSYSGSLSYAYLPSNWLVPLFQYAITQYDDKFNEENLFNPTDNFTYVASPDNKDTYIIFIIGETARWDHMGLLGYHRDTTPLLSKEKNLIAFKGQSCDTATKLSLRCMFVREGGTEDNEQRTLKENNIFSVLKTLGFSSELFAMQGEVWFYNKLDADNYVLREMITAKNSTYGKQIDDTLLANEVKLSLSKYTQGQHLIILHTKGSHYLYSKRYPREFAKYQPECLNIDDKCSEEQYINAYDNSILYTDYFIEQVINSVRDKNAIILYASDHGETISAKGGLHGTPRNIAPPEQFRVPLLVWMSDSYLAKPQNKQLFEQLKANKDSDRLFQHYQLYDTILGCLGFTSPNGGINDKNNLCHFPTLQ